MARGNIETRGRDKHRIRIYAFVNRKVDHRDNEKVDHLGMTY